MTRVFAISNIDSTTNCFSSDISDAAVISAMIDTALSQNQKVKATHDEERSADKSEKRKNCS